MSGYFWATSELCQGKCCDFSDKKEGDGDFVGYLNLGRCFRVFASLVAVRLSCRQMSEIAIAGAMEIEEEKKKEGYDEFS